MSVLGRRRSADRQAGSPPALDHMDPRLLAGALATMVNAVFITDRDGQILWANPAFTELSGYDAAHVVGRTPRILKSGVHDASFYAQVWAKTLAGDAWQGEVVERHRDGHHYTVNQTITPLVDERGVVTHFVAMHEDISQRIHDARALAQDNRWLRAVTDHVGEALVSLDVDGRIVYANPSAQRLLAPRGLPLVAGSWLNRLLGTDDLGRPGDVRHKMIAEDFASIVVDHPTEDYLLRDDGTVVPIEYIGSELPVDDKGEPTGWVVTFTDITDRRAREDLQQTDADTKRWIARINDALDHDRLVLHAQPIVAIATGETVQHELLIRMIGDDGTLIPPMEFLPIAEAHGLAPAIDRWVIGQAVQLAGRGMPVELNISAATLGDDSVFDHFEVVLAASGVDSTLLLFEITETAVATDMENASRFVARLKALGCQIALDDFGMGYGAFSYLKHVPIDVLKIDLAFVADATDNQSSRNVVAAIVSLARAFGMSTVAEGVEDDATLQVLADLDVDFAQGYLFGRPRPVDEVFGSLQDGDQDE